MQRESGCRARGQEASSPGDPLTCPKGLDKAARRWYCTYVSRWRMDPRGNPGAGSRRLALLCARGGACRCVQWRSMAGRRWGTTAAPLSRSLVRAPLSAVPRQTCSLLRHIPIDQLSGSPLAGRSPPTGRGGGGAWAPPSRHAHAALRARRAGGRTLAQAVSHRWSAGAGAGARLSTREPPAWREQHAPVIAEERAHTTPLNDSVDGGRLVVSASQGGAPPHPDWYRHLVAHPAVTSDTGWG